MEPAEPALLPGSTAAVRMAMSRAGVGEGAPDLNASCLKQLGIHGSEMGPVSGSAVRRLSRCAAGALSDRPPCCVAGTLRWCPPPVRPQRAAKRTPAG